MQHGVSYMHEILRKEKHEALKHQQILIVG